MCCSERHYPKSAGIFRTDHEGIHKHYADVITMPSAEFNSLGERDEEIWETNDEHPSPPRCRGEEGDHWHAILPVRLTVCIDNNGPVAFTLRAQDWFRWTRDRSMGLPVAAKIHYQSDWWASGKFGIGYDFVATFGCSTKAERDRVREKVLVAISEGMDISAPALNHLLASELKSTTRVKYRNSTAVTRGETPDLNAWLRGNPFVKPPISGNELLYGMDMGSYIMADGGGGSWDENTNWAGITDLGDAAIYQPEVGVQRQLVKTLTGTTAEHRPTVAAPARRKPRRPRENVYAPKLI